MPPDRWEAAFFWRILVFGGLPGLCAGLAGIGLGLARTIPNRALAVPAAVAGLAAAIVVNALLRGEIVSLATISIEDGVRILIVYLVLVAVYIVLYARGRQQVTQSSTATPAEATQRTTTASS